MALVQEIDCRLFRHQAILPRYQCYHKDLTDAFAKSEISSREQIPIQRVWFVWPILVRILVFSAFQSHQYTCYLLKIIFILVNQHWLLSDMNVIQRIWYFCEIIYTPNRIYPHPRNVPRYITKHIEPETKWPPCCRRHFQMHALEWKFMNFIKISLKFVTKGQIKIIPALVQIMAWCRPGGKPLSEPIMVMLPTHVCA